MCQTLQGTFFGEGRAISDKEIRKRLKISSHRNTILLLAAVQNSPCLLIQRASISLAHQYHEQ